MSIGLENLVNVTGVSSDYPWKDIKDDTGAGDGTPLDQISHSDYHQTFRKLLSIARITPNGQPDNVTNGYQYVDALDKLYKNYIGIIGNSSNTTFVNTDINKLVITGGSGTVVNTLPLGSTLRDGDCITFLNVGSGTFTVLENTGDSIAYNPGVFQLNDYIRLVYNKSLSIWFTVDYRQTPTPFAINIITVGSGGGAPAFQNSWLANSPMKFFIDDKDFVHLNGIVHKTGAISGSTNLIFTLPAGYRPATPFTIWVWYYDSGTVGQVPLNILANGDVTIDQTQLSVFGDTIVRIQAIHFYKNW